jgi:hypothetical protein
MFVPGLLQLLVHTHKRQLTCDRGVLLKVQQLTTTAL